MSGAGDPGDWEGAPAPSGRTRGGVVVAIAAAVGVGLALTSGGTAPEPTDLVVEESEDHRPPVEEPTTSPAAPTPGPPAELHEVGGAWFDEPAAPVDIPGEHIGLWACPWADGRCELVVWGGRGETAGFDPAARAWRELAPTPFPNVVGEPIWTGGHLIVWNAERGGDAPVGAAYDPAADAWTPLPPPPEPAPVAPAVVWTGREVVRLGFTATPDGPPGPPAADAYDPAAGTWRRLPDPPLQVFGSIAGLWAGDQAVFWGRHTGEVVAETGREELAVAFDPTTGSWRELPPPPLFDPPGAAAVWTGSALVLWGRPAAHASGPAAANPPRGASLRLHEGRQGSSWSLLPLVRTEVPPLDNLYGLAAVWTGEHMLIVGGYGRSVALAYAPRTAAWQTLPPVGGLVNPVAAWTGDELLLWGGFTAAGPTVELRSWRPSLAASGRQVRRGGLVGF